MRSAMVAAAATLAAIVAMTAPARPEAEAPGCAGGRTVVERGDTLSRIAERCGVGEGRILRANPSIDSSADLAVGMELRLDDTGMSLAETERQLRAFAERAGETLSGLAGDFQASIDDLLAKNPDLRRRLEELKERVAVARPDADAALVAEPQAGPTGTDVALSVSGVPADTEVVVGAGLPGRAYDILARTRTGSDGALRTRVRVPDWVEPGDRLVFTIARPDAAWTLRSSPFEVTPGAKL